MLAIASPLIKLDIPEKLVFFYNEKARYKVAYGGRGAGKSWAAAICLVLLAFQGRQKILCTRAYQNSILDSVHSLLVGAINRLGLQSSFEITKTGIKTKHRGSPELESEFIFKGLQNNIDEIKSMEGVTICWVEEAHSIDAEGWKTLIPTIRYKGAEIWITFNPKYATDATYVRFVENPRPNSIVAKVNYYDNPFFKGTELVAEMEFDRDNNNEEYRQTWLGEPRALSDAVVFKDLFTIKEFDDHPIELCYKKKRFFGLDFGYNDPTVAIRCYLIDNILYITHEAYKRQILPGEIANLIGDLPDIKDFRFTIYGDSSRPDLINDLYFKSGFKNVRSVKKSTKNQDNLDKQKAKSYVRAGIDFMKRFKIVIHPRCVETIKEFQNYSWKVEKDANDKEKIIDELIDDWNHCIDALRYALADLIIKGRITMADIAHAIGARKAMAAQKFKLVDDQKA